MPDTSGSYGLLENLTRPVVENLSDVPVVSAAFAALLEEVAAPTEGTRALTSALMKACLVVLLRRHLETSRIAGTAPARSEEHTSEHQSLMRISFAAFCLEKNKKTT